MQQLILEKLEDLKQILKKMENVAIAFSGGVDSTFLVKVAKEVLRDKVLAITATSSIHPEFEKKDAKIFAEQNNIRHIFLKSEELKNENFRANPPNRCYLCKKELFSAIKNITNKENIKYILDATNSDDLSEYRPGIKALEELGIISPLKDVKLTKEEIRALSKEMNLKSWNKPAFACLVSRIPYGIEITEKRLKMIERAEEYIMNLGISQIRVRYHDNIARIEINKNDIPLLLKHSDEINAKLKKLGFTYITLDLEGYRTGSLNEVLDI